MNRSDKPRKVYVRKGILHVCFAGKLYAPNGETSFKQGDEVVVTANTDEYVGVAGGDPERAECWSVIEIESRPRAGVSTKAQRAKAKPVQDERKARPRGRTTGKLEADACESVAAACKKLGIKWSAEDERAHRAYLRKQGKFGAARRGMV